MNKEVDEMSNYQEVYQKTELFQSIKAEDLTGLLECLGSRTVTYNKGDYLWSVGDYIVNVGIVLEGKLQIFRDDALGNRSILAEINPAQMFGEAFICAGLKCSPVTVMAVTDCSVLFINIERMLTVCTVACMFHNQIVRNLLKIVANKNIELNQKNSLLSQRSTRDKLMAFFYFQMGKTNSKQFEISFNRSELADYLCVDRSALSRELSKLQDEGVIAYNKNQFEVRVEGMLGEHYEQER
jgi:CRP-like cAMP-binding protein